MTREISLDYRTCDVGDIDDALRKYIAREIDNIRINNIYPAILEDRYDMEIEYENGFDMDWWGTIKYLDCERVDIPVYGCCRYGYIQTEREDEDDENNFE